jgi:hypothetical protein
MKWNIIIIEHMLLYRITNKSIIYSIYSVVLFVNVKHFVELIINLLQIDELWTMEKQERYEIILNCFILLIDALAV